MKLLKYTIATLFFAGSAAVSANTPVYEAADSSYESQLCVSLTKASTLKASRLIADAHISKMPSLDYRLVANNITCNGENIADFARQVGNDKLANRLAQYQVRYGQIKDIAAKQNGNVNLVTSD